MSKLLAVRWNFESLRFVFGESGKNGSLRVIQAGERIFATASSPVEDTAQGDTAQGDTAQDDPAREDPAQEDRAVEDGAQDAPPAADITIDPALHIAALVRELKAGKATLLLCLNRAVVDSATFDVPPASDAELPTIVRNMALRQLPGLTDDSVLDFITYPPASTGGRAVNVMALAAAEQQQIEEIAAASGCARQRALVVTHPLSLFAPPVAEDNTTATLVVSKGQQLAHLLLLKNNLPVLSRSLRLAQDMKGEDEAEFIAAETSRTLLACATTTDDELKIGQIVVVGSEIESASLISVLGEHLGADVLRVSVKSVVDGEAGDASVSAYAPLVAAMKQEASGIAPAVDFLHPRRPPKATRQRNRILAAATMAVVLVAGGWYYVHAQFAEATAENTRLKTRLRELDDLVRETRSKRNLAKVLTAWEDNRLSWLDELRDITIRTPSSPRLVLQQLSAAASGSNYVVSFRGIGQTPDVIRAMEEQLRDKWHEPRTPGIRELKEGKNSLWSFQTTMNLKSRDKDQYVSHLADANEKSEVRP
ncbi:MAG: hypothetical protein RIK87_11710 [Fuerstiella sp.]